MKSDLVIYNHYFYLLKYSYMILNKFTDQSLINDIRSLLTKGIKLIIETSKCFDKNTKLQYLNELDTIMSVLFLYVRISYSNKHISMRNYGAWCKKITDIVNMNNKWILSCRKV